MSSGGSRGARTIPYVWRTEPFLEIFRDAYLEVDIDSIFVLIPSSNRGHIVDKGRHDGAGDNKINKSKAYESYRQILKKRKEELNLPSPITPLIQTLSALLVDEHKNQFVEKIIDILVLLDGLVYDCLVVSSKIQEVPSNRHRVAELKYESSQALVDKMINL